MALSLEQLRLALSNEEPQYVAIAAQLKSSNTAHLKKLSKDPDPMLASKAVYLASLSTDSAALDIVDQAALSDRSLVKIAAASALAHMPDNRKNALAEKLIDDDSVAIQKLVVRGISNPSADLQRKLRDLSTSSSSTAVRKLCTDRLRNTP